MTEAESKIKLSREDVHGYIKAFLTDAEASKTIFNRAKQLTSLSTTPHNEDDLLALYEKAQAEFFTKLYREKLESQEAREGVRFNETNEKGAEALSRCVDPGAEILKVLQVAAQLYPDDETEQLLTKMCLLIESHLQILENINVDPKTLFSSPDAQQQMTETVERLQAKMNSGQPPSAEDVREVSMLQMKMMAYMQSVNRNQGTTPQPGGMT